MKFLLLKSGEEVETFRKGVKARELCPGVICGSFGNSKVLCIAPHAGGERIELNGLSFFVREKNTDLLAFLGARASNGSFLVSYVPRTKADFARNPEDLGKELFLRWRPKKGVVVKVPIHRDRSFYECLKKFHEKIEEFNPSFIISYHAMYNRKFDILLGFGKRKQYIGGFGNAKRFRELVYEIGGKEIEELRIGIGKARLTGESEFILKTHVNQRFGVLAEFNGSRIKDVPEESFQIAAQAIALAARRWVFAT